MCNTDCFAKCARGLMIAFNILFLLVGLSVLVTGIVLMVSPSTILSVIERVDIEKLLKGFNAETLKIGAILFMSTGGMTFLLGFLGFVGAWKKVRVLLGIFFALVLLMVLVEVAIGIAATVMKSEVRASTKIALQAIFNDTINGDNPEDVKLFHILEEQFSCCGVEGPADYPNPQKHHCAYDGKMPVGCWDALMTFVDQNIYIFIGIGLCIGFFEILALVFSCYLFRYFGKTRKTA